MIVPPQTLLLQIVLQSQQFQTQQYGSARITKLHDEYNVEVPTNYIRTTCCEVMPLKEETYYCYAAPPYFATCNIYRRYC